MSKPPEEPAQEAPAAETATIQERRSAVLVRAHKAHWCDACGAGGHISPGDLYLRGTVYPGDDAHHWVTQLPVSLTECRASAERYGRGHLFTR